MKILDKLFRRKKGSIDIVTITPTDTAQVNSRATYYADMLLDANLKPLTKKGHFPKILSEFPTDKVVVFFNAQLLEVASEQDFVALDEYINLAKEKKAEKAFYRGLPHGPAVLSAFSKDLIPEKFDGVFFFGCPVVAMYL